MTLHLEWTPDMAHVSGADAAGEEECRRMVRAGVAWLESHPNAKPVFHLIAGRVLVCRTLDAKAMLRAVGARVDVGRVAVSGALVVQALQHALAVRQMGWEAYAAQARRIGPPKVSA